MAGPSFECGMCEKTFSKRTALQQHMLRHKEIKKQSFCEVCKWAFDDELSLEQHRILSDHNPAPDFACDSCPKHFISLAKLEEHKRFPSACSDAFRSKKPQKPQESVKLQESVNPAPRVGPGEHGSTQTTAHGTLFRYHEEDLIEYSDRETQPREGPVNGTASMPVRVTVPAPKDALGVQRNDDNGVFCNACTKSFPSQAQYAYHFLGCRPPAESKPQQDQAAVAEPVDSTAPTAMTAVQAKISNDSASLQYSHPESGSAATGQPSQISPTPMVHGRSKQASTRTQEQPLPPKVPTVAQNRAPSAVSLAHQRPLPRQGIPSAPGPVRGKSPVSMPQHSRPETVHNATVGEYKCTVVGCHRAFKSEPGLKTHKSDAHGIGGRGLDLNGRDSYMLPQRSRDLLAKQGLLRQSQMSTPPRQKSAPARAFNTPSPGMQNTTVTSVGGLEEEQQAQEIAGKVMRLLLQTNVLIEHTGKIKCAGIDWIRIPVAKQAQIGPMFDELCHLPKELQGEEYVPRPESFKSSEEYRCYYPVVKFKHSPDQSELTPALGVVALSCIKIVLTNGCYEAVKIAAVDVATARILMNNFICTDPTASVQDWRKADTGLTGFKDIDAAREEGYKVFKGWDTVRTALGKFIDKETIILGHNLRADLDSLRMIHGRAVDLAILFEKAADGPLSKQQLSLETLCADLPKIKLSNHLRFGRDALQNAFAVRELALWKIKNEKQWVSKAEEKSLDYQRIARVLST